MNEQATKQARRNQTAILQALGKIGQEKVADAIGCSGSTLSVFKAEHMERLCQVLAVCGLKVAQTNEESVSADEIWALRVLAIKQLENGKGPDSGYGGL